MARVLSKKSFLKNPPSAIPPGWNTVVRGSVTGGRETLFSLRSKQGLAPPAIAFSPAGETEAPAFGTSSAFLPPRRL